MLRICFNGQLFGGGRNLNSGFYIYDTLFIPTELNSRRHFNEQFNITKLISLKKIITKLVKKKLDGMGF